VETAEQPAIEPEAQPTAKLDEVPESPGKSKKAKKPKAAVLAPVVVEPPKPVKPAPKAAAPCCQLCVHFVPNDERGALYSDAGVCDNVAIRPVVQAEQSCDSFRFNETLRDGLK